MNYLLGMLSIFLMYSMLARANPVQGGVSGGGGNFIEPKAPAAPLPLNTVDSLIRRSQLMVLKYISDKRAAFDSHKLSPQQMEIFAPVFMSKKKIEERITGMKVQIDDKKACTDRARRPFDGSTVASEANAICISAFRIAAKTETKDVVPQAAALLLHEFSEVVGLTEDQAVRVQVQALQEFRHL